VTVLNGLKACQLSYGDWVAVPGAGGGLGHLAVQYAIATGMKVVGIDTGAEKRKLVEGYGGVFIDFKEEKVSGRGLVVSSKLTRLTGHRCRRKASDGRQRAPRSIDICCVRRSLHHGEWSDSCTKS
jgi:NADPH:quinone reductase-like Zn-dependent oxidoreductase